MLMTNPAIAKPRCPWCLGSDAYMRYHDVEWGKPVHDHRVLYKFLILEGARLPLRRPDNLLRFHAGGGLGQRSPCRLFQV
jgi:hypothetical protein